LDSLIESQVFPSFDQQGVFLLIATMNCDPLWSSYRSEHQNWLIKACYFNISLDIRLYIIIILPRNLNILLWIKETIRIIFWEPIWKISHFEDPLRQFFLRNFCKERSYWSNERFMVHFEHLLTLLSKNFKNGSFVAFWEKFIKLPKKSVWFIILNQTRYHCLGIFLCFWLRILRLKFESFKNEFNPVLESLFWVYQALQTFYKRIDIFKWLVILLNFLIKLRLFSSW